MKYYIYNYRLIYYFKKNKKGNILIFAKRNVPENLIGKEKGDC
jgi:hypothetical protein